jgi:hypothetical protein
MIRLMGGLPEFKKNSNKIWICEELNKEQLFYWNFPRFGL